MLFTLNYGGVREGRAGRDGGETLGLLTDNVKIITNKRDKKFSNGAHRNRIARRLSPSELPLPFVLQASILVPPSS